MKYIKPTFVPFENQKENIKQLVTKRRCLLSDKCGAGKTASVLYAFAFLKEKQKLDTMLVLTPLSAFEKQVWKKDIVKFTNFNSIDIETLVDLIGGDYTKLPKLLSHYDIIYGKHTHIKKTEYLELIKRLLELRCLLVVDEVHAFRNPSSALTLTLRNLTRESKTFWGITATTISRNLENLYNIVNLVQPWYLGSWFQFSNTYCEIQQKSIGYDPVTKKKRMVNEVVGLKNPVALHSKLEPLLITGASFIEAKFAFVDYKNSVEEASIYKRIAKGIAEQQELSPEDWFKYVMSNDVESKKIENIEKYSTRFIYLQYAADGIINQDLTYTRHDSVKMSKLVDLVNSIALKGQSVLIYFDYYASVEVAKDMLSKIPNIDLHISTGETKLKEGTLTEAACKRKSQVVLCTRAASESASYYFINNVVFFHIPTIPSVFTQFLGRITRKNTLFPEDLNCYIFTSDNIDLYKLMVVSGKTRLMEESTGEREANVPETYKQVQVGPYATKRYKQILLWK